MSRENILIIKLSALGDFVQAMGPFQAIRRHHPDAKITLLTTKPYVELAEKSGWFDEVWLDAKPKLTRFGAVRALRRQLRDGRFARVYDLQTSDRSSFYYRLMWPGRPEWSGIARGCSHPHANPERDFMHTIDRQREQLAMAGIDQVPLPDAGWMQADLARFNLPPGYVLLIPGGAPHRPDKRWPGTRYGELAARLAENGMAPVVLGTASEAAEAGAITKATPQAISLVGQTSLFEIAALARGARAAIGNDTGPMHLAAVSGAPVLALYSHASDPALCGQRGARVEILRHDPLAALTAEQVWQGLQALTGES